MLLALLEELSLAPLQQAGTWAICSALLQIVVSGKPEAQGQGQGKVSGRCTCLAHTVHCSLSFGDAGSRAVRESVLAKGGSCH